MQRVVHIPDAIDIDLAEMDAPQNGGLRRLFFCNAKKSKSMLLSLLLVLLD